MNSCVNSVLCVHLHVAFAFWQTVCIWSCRVSRKVFCKIPVYHSFGLTLCLAKILTVQNLVVRSAFFHFGGGFLFFFLVFHVYDPIAMLITWLHIVLQVLCRSYPSEFVSYFHYCRSLRFEDKPDYSYLKRLFRDLFIQEGMCL